MGKSDIVIKQYMRDAEVFADAFNFLLYEGVQVIEPDHLNELDTAELAAISGKGGKDVGVQVFRDILKYATVMVDGESAYVILGIENQTGISYTMPVRNMLYDVLQYNAQLSEARRNYRLKEGTHISGDEFLSGFRKGDKLIPVITLVVYFGEKSWDGPKSLREMFAVKDDRIIAYAADYRINLIEPAAMSDEEIGRLKSDLKEVFYFIKYSRDKDRLQKLIDENEDYRCMRRSAVEVIREVTRTQVSIPDGKERVDMCLAIEQMKQEAREEGIKEGKKEGIKEGKKEGRLDVLLELVNENIVSEAQFRKKMREAGF